LPISTRAWSTLASDKYPDRKAHQRKKSSSFLAGGRAFAVGNERVLFYGGYGEQSTACNLLQLGDVDAKVVREVSLVLLSGLDLSKARVIGRGKELHVFFGDDWYVFSIDSIK
jgi:hypothetical protein